MNLPNLVKPVTRNSVFMPNHLHQIEPSWCCGLCKGAIGRVGSLLIGEGCAEAVAGFEVACNVAFDGIPFIGEGPAEVACAAGEVVLGVACRAAGGTVTHDVIQQVEKTVCSKIGCC